MEKRGNASFKRRVKFLMRFLRPNIHWQILQTDLHSFPVRVRWENLIKDQIIFSLIINLFTLTKFTLEDVLILLGENWYWSGLMIALHQFLYIVKCVVYCFVELIALSRLIFLSQTFELGVTEHVAEDSCKFAVWTGKPPQSEDKRVIKVSLQLTCTAAEQLVLYGNNIIGVQYTCTSPIMYLICPLKFA